MVLISACFIAAHEACIGVMVQGMDGSMRLLLVSLCFSASWVWGLGSV